MAQTQYGPYRDRQRRGDWDDRQRGIGARYQDDERGDYGRRHFDPYEGRGHYRDDTDWGPERHDMRHDMRRGDRDREPMARHGDDRGRSGYARQEPDRGPDPGFGESDPWERGRYGGSGWDEERPHGERRYSERDREGRSFAGGAETGWSRSSQENFRGKGPKGYSRSDERILEDVNDRLSDDPSIDASEITAKVSDGEVTLDGHVASRQAKRRAEDCVEDCSGVKHVQNNLRVRDSSQGSSAASGQSGDQSGGGRAKQ